MMWLTTALQIILFSQLAHTAPNWTSVTLRYFDYSMKYQDFYFDRIVPLVYNIPKRNNGLLYGIGVLISRDRILTSFNPFRSVIRNQTFKRELYAVVLTGRIRTKIGTWTYKTNKLHLACGRQIQDLPDDEITRGDLWHGMGNRHCPLHDLLVFRILGSLQETTMKLADHHMGRYPDGTDSEIDYDGVFFTRLAKPFHKMRSNFKFCSVHNLYQLVVIEHKEDDNAVVDCDEWLPRDWGYFICILNIHNCSEVSSGGMLMSHETLFGVASFILFRGTQSIIVFTDIRHYEERINKTCKP